MRENKGGGRGGGGGGGWASRWGLTNCHSEEGDRVCFKERSCWSVLWIECLPPPSPHPSLHPHPHRSPRPPSRQVQNRLYLLWEEEEKMCSVIRLPAASQENWVVAVAGLQGVCGSLCDLCLLWTLSIGVRWLTGATAPVVDLIKAFSCWISFALNLLGDQRQSGNADRRCEAETWLKLLMCRQWSYEVMGLKRKSQSFFLTLPKSCVKNVTGTACILPTTTSNLWFLSLIFIVFSCEHYFAFCNPS